MVKAHLSFLMASRTLETTTETKSMAMVASSGVTPSHMKVGGKMANNMDMESFTRKVSQNQLLG